MYKIKVKPEGREDIWIPEKESLKKYIRAKRFTSIHNIIPDGNIMFGADHEVNSVFRDIDRADEIAIFTDKSFNDGHSLALIYKNRLEIYDIGEIKKKVLDMRGNKD